LGDGSRAAAINYGYLANPVVSTDDAVKAMRQTLGGFLGVDPLADRAGIHYRWGAATGSRQSGPLHI
jgi:hypothetical protein